MKTESNPIYVSFHIGRGGRFHNPGHLSFVGEENFQDLIGRCLDTCSIINTKWDDDKNDEVTLPDDEWKFVDGGGNIILEGREEIEAMTGRLEWDTAYDTDYVTTTDKLTDGEIDVIWDVYKNGRYMSDELKDAICSLKDLKRVHYIKTYPSNLELHTQEGIVSLDIDHQQGVFTEDEWREQLEDEYCPFSVDMIVDELDRLDMFKENTVYYIGMSYGDRVCHEKFVYTENDVENGGSVDGGENFAFDSWQEAKKQKDILQSYCDEKGYTNINFRIIED